MARGSGQPADSLLYGASRKEPFKRPPGPFDELPELDLELRAPESSDLTSDIKRAQQVVDHISGWDKVTQNWLRDAYKEEWKRGGVPREAYDLLDRWSDDTQKRFKLGVAHHSELGLIWTAWNDIESGSPDREASRDPYGDETPPGDTVLYGERLGELLAKVHDLLNCRQDDVPVPPGLNDYIERRRSRPRAFGRDWDLRHLF